uniref:Disease resistance protein At4g27190-like leucine-rich repeats domain-containing protein n=1 Tax=Fagus sylvatica TaxID=28930 RepID=A0A2N9FVH6_FAGSY
MEQLKYLSIENCKVMEEVLLSEDLGEEEEIIPNVLFPRLNALILKDLPCPQKILRRNSGITVSKEVTEMNSEEISLTTMQPLFNEESLEKLIVYDCGSLQEIFELQGQDVRETQAVTTIPLKELDLRRLPKMKQDLQLVDCGVEEIVAQEYGAEAAARLVFPKSLEKLVVQDCGSLQEIFELQGQDVRETQAVTAIPLKELDLRRLLKMKQEYGAEAAARLVFPKVTFLLLSKLPKLKWFYQGVHTSEWPLLKTLRVNGCDQIEIFISKSLSFQERVEESQLKTSIQQPLFLVEESLEKLIVQNCGSLQEIFELQGQDVRETQAVTAIPLKELEFVSSTENEATSVARCLMQLKDLQVVDCGAEEIVAQEYGAEAAARLVFPKVTFLLLSKLPKLKWFYQGVHTSEWPLLKTLRVNGCDQIEIFISKSLSFQERVEESQLKTSIQQPLFLVEESLEKLYRTMIVVHYKKYLNYKDKMLRETQAVTTIPLKELDLRRLPKMKQDLRIVDCGVEEIVAQEDGAEAAARLVFPKVTDLLLCKLPKLKWFYQGVHTSEWPLLKTFGAKSLVQLKKLSVSECESITEVVAGEGGEGNEVITFSQLTYLKLDCLPNLTSFCSRSYSFEFPSLEEVIVSKCPEMKIFCHGILSTPKLERVQATKEDEWHWKVDLNTTVRTLALEGQTMIPLCNSSSE